MHHYIENNEYKIDIDFTVDVNLKSFKEEVLDYVYGLYLLHGNMPLLFSGGNDSVFLMRTLVELGIKPDLVSFTLLPGEETLPGIKNICARYSLKEPEYIYISKSKVMEHINYTSDVRNLMYPMLHGFVMDYVLSIFKNTKFLTGMGSEFKQYETRVMLPPGPWLVKNNNPGRLFDFTNSRTFLSYVNDNINKLNYNRPMKFIELENKNVKANFWYIRDLIYNNCYPDLNLPPKDGFTLQTTIQEDERIFNKKLKKSSMNNIKPFYFDLNNYFLTKQN